MPYIGHDDITIISTSFLVTISIYVPREGHNTNIDKANNLTMFNISIYVPRAGHNLTTDGFVSFCHYFNLCAPCGAQLKSEKAHTGIMNFNLCAPCGAQHKDVTYNNGLQIFQFMCPMRGTTPSL